MRVLRSWEALSQHPELRGGAVTIGNFDGVHMGHRQVLAELKGHALDVGGPAIVVSFEPHPRAVLFPNEAPRRLSHLHERLEQLGKAGADAVLLLRFNHELAAWDGEQFIRTLYESCTPKHIHVGYDFAFGRGRSGGPEAIREQGELLGFNFTQATAFELEGSVVSSSRIRSAVEAADFDLATHLLGHPYSISGHVMHGDKRGRRIGFPTANLDVADLTHPPVGIYAVKAKCGDEQWNGAAYLGFRPTFEGRTLLLETHMLDVTPELYNQRLKISFVRRVREDRVFRSAEELARQIAVDCEAARRILTESPL